MARPHQRCPSVAVTPSVVRRGDLLAAGANRVACGAFADLSASQFGRHSRLTSPAHATSLLTYHECVHAPSAYHFQPPQAGPQRPSVFTHLRGMPHRAAGLRWTCDAAGTTPHRTDKHAVAPYTGLRILAPRTLYPLSRPAPTRTCLPAWRASALGRFGILSHAWYRFSNQSINAVTERDLVL